MRRTGFKKPTLEDILKRSEESAKKRVTRGSKLAQERSNTSKTSKVSFKKKKTVKRPKKLTLTKLKKLVWEELKRVVRSRYVKDGQVHCYTCDTVITSPSGMHTAHFIDSSVCTTDMKYSLDNLRICCYLCNVTRNGNKVEYYRRIVQELGQESVDALYARSKEYCGSHEAFYLQRLEELKSL
jgi:hypothetical protein